MRGTLCSADIDECDEPDAQLRAMYCPENATCNNTNGGYECYCDPGFNLVDSVGCIGNY